MTVKTQMRESQSPTASVLSWAVGLGFLSAAVAAAMMPSELQANPDITPHQFWTILARDPTSHLLMHWAFAATGLFGIGLVALMWKRDGQSASALYAVASALGLVGFAVLTRSHLMEVEFDQRVLPLYNTADPAFQSAVHVVAGLALDVPNGFLTLGLIALWIGTVSVHTYRSGQASVAFLALGLATSLTFILGVVGYTFYWQMGIVISFAAGNLIAGPLWHLWLGVTLLRPRTA